MFVFPIVENEISEALVANTTVQTGQQSVSKATQQSKVIARTNKSGNVNAKTFKSGAFAKNQNYKENFQSKSYSEEPVVKDSLWNIYNGNPGFYITKGDTANFGNVRTLTDSVFLERLHTVVPKTIKPYGFVGKEVTAPNQDWVLGIILILWVIFATVRVGFLKYLGQLFTSLVNFHAASRLYGQGGYKTMFGAVRLDIIFHLILPLSVFQIATFFKIDIPGYPSILLFIAILLVINGYLFIKNMISRLAGSIVMLKEQTEESLFNIKLYYKALGLILLPVATIHAAIAETNVVTVWVMAGFIAIMYIAAVIRSIYLGNRKDVSIFYLILYLCTLEILPLLLIFKLMSAK